MKKWFKLIPSAWVETSHITPYSVLVIKGKIYRWWGFFGTQLESRETRQILPGEERCLAINDKKFVFTVRRTEKLGFRRYTAVWGLSNHGTCVEQEARINEFRDALRKTW